MTIVAMLGLFYISTFLDLSDKWFKGQTTFGQILAFLWWSTPQFMAYIIALAVLLAALVTIGVLTKNSELIVMRACGVSLYRTAAPMLAFALVASAILFGMEERVLAFANRRADQLKHLIRGGSAQTFDVLNRKWIVGRGGEVYHYQFFNPRTRELNGLSVFEFDPKTHALTRRVYAQRAVYQPGTPAVQQWQLTAGWARKFGVKAAARRPSSRSPKGWSGLETADYFVTEVPEPRRMTYPAAQSLHRRAAPERLRRARARGRAVPQGRLPVRHAGHDVHRRPVCGHDRAAGRHVRHRHRHRAGARVLDDDLGVRGVRRRRRDQPAAGGVGARTCCSAPQRVCLLLTVRT